MSSYYCLSYDPNKEHCYNCPCGFNLRDNFDDCENYSCYQVSGRMCFYYSDVVRCGTRFEALLALKLKEK